MWSNQLDHTLTDASELAADLDAPKTNIAKTAVAATFEEDNARRPAEWQAEWQAPLSEECLFCNEAKEHPKVATMSKQGRSCILCHVEEDVSICRKCLVPWQAAYDSNNAFSHVLKYARAEDEPHMLCLDCVREDMENEQQLTLPPCALNDQAHLQLEKIRTVVAQLGQHPIQVLASQSLASWLGAPADLPALALPREHDRSRGGEHDRSRGEEN